MTRRRITAVVAAAVLFLCTGSASPAERHPLHTTLTVVTVSRDGRVDVSMRAFLDDYSAATRVHARGGAADEGAMIGYARAGFVLLDSRGQHVPVHGCGARVEADVVWLCLRGTVAPGVRLRARNSVLFEHFDDQVNIVQLVRDGRRSSVLFTRGDQAKSLEG